MSSSDSPPPVAAHAQSGGGLWSTLTRPWWQRITFRLTLLVLAVSILPPLTLGVLAMRSARVAQESEVRERNAAVASWGVDKVESYLGNIVENMRLLVELGDLQAIEPVAAKPLLSYFLSFMDDVKEVSLIDARGQERVRLAESMLVTPRDLTSQAGSPKFQISLSGETYIGPVRTSEFSEPFLSVAVPIRSLTEDRVVGVLAAEVNLKRLWDEVLSFRVGQGGYLYLVNGEGQLFAHPDFSLVLARRDLSRVGAVQRFLKGEDDHTARVSLEYTNYQGAQVLGVFARSPKLGWGVVVEQPTAEAFANVNRMKIETTVILVNTMVVTLVLAIMCARALTRPLADLAQGARLLGAGDFGHRIPVRYQDEIAEVAERFNAMADQLQEGFQRLRTLLETSSMTSSSLELEKVLTTALEQMDLLAGRAQSGIVLVEEALGSGPSLRVTVRTVGTDGGARPLALTPEEYPHVWRALAAAGTLSVDDVAEAAGPGERGLWMTQGLGAVVLLPLLSKGQSLGVLWMGQTAPGPFAGDEVALGQTMANHVAIAIDNARLFEATERAARETRSLYEVAHTLTTSLDPVEVLNLISMKTTELLGTPHAQVVLWDEDTRTLHLGAAHGTQAEKVKSQEFRLGEGVNGTVAETRAPLIVNDYQAYPKRVPGMTELVAVIGVPLLYRGRLLGILSSHATRPGWAFTENHLALLTSFADQAAIAIDNARLYDALRRTSEELESRVEARTQELRDAHEELVRRERLALVGQLAGGVGHELRNPLGAIGNAVYYLRMRLAGGDDAKVQKHLTILENEVRRANKIVTDLLDFSRMKQPSRTPAQLNAVIQDILSRQPLPPSVTLELDLADPLPPVLVDTDQVGQVLLNMVINAVEAMPDGGTLTIRTQQTDEAVIARVTDTGVGIPPENLEKIFQPLFSTKTKGIGLGLAVSRRLTEANGGTLSVESRMGHGSTFTATFPVDGQGVGAHG